MRNEDFIREGKKLVEKANKEGVLLRLLGACAIAIKCEEQSIPIARQITDLDFMSLSMYKRKIIKIFQEEGYNLRTRFVAYLGKENRLIFDHPDMKIVADVFLDRLSMCHTIDFRNRLNIDKFTIPLEDLLLEKLQIVKISSKDIEDVYTLLKAYEVLKDENKENNKRNRSGINSDYISSLLAKDWGLYYTVTENLKKVHKFAKDNNVKSKIDILLKDIDRKPKSILWKARALIGAKKKWYRDVEEQY